MTDRHIGYLVTLEEAIREDDAEDLIKAMKLLKGVLTVEPIGNDITHQMAKRRAISELTDKLWKVLYPK